MAPAPHESSSLPTAQIRIVEWKVFEERLYDCLLEGLARVSSCLRWSSWSDWEQEEAAGRSGHEKSVEDSFFYCCTGSLLSSCVSVENEEERPQAIYRFRKSRGDGMVGFAPPTWVGKSTCLAAAVGRAKLEGGNRIQRCWVKSRRLP